MTTIEKLRTLARELAGDGTTSAVSWPRRRVFAGEPPER